MAIALRKVTLVGGSGRLGPHILQALHANPAFDVTVITRKSSQAQFPPGTKVAKISDEYPKEEAIELFRGQDAVVLSLNHAAGEHHDTLVDASVEAHVKRLIPSIYGGRNDVAETLSIFPIAAKNAATLERVKSHMQPGWSYTAISCGLFMELCVGTNFFGFDPISHSGTIWDSGCQKFSCSKMAAIGFAVSQVLSMTEETANRTVYISSYETSMNDLLAAYKEATGTSEWDITYSETTQGIKDAQSRAETADNFMDKMRAIGRLALLSGLTEGSGADFVAEGISDNELLGIPRENVIDTVREVFQEKQK